MRPSKRELNFYKIAFFALDGKRHRMYVNKNHRFGDAFRIRSILKIIFGCLYLDCSLEGLLEPPGFDVASILKGLGEDPTRILAYSKKLDFR